MFKRYLILMLLYPFGALGQNSHIEGKITNTANDIIAGATVRVLRTNTCVISTNNGSFNLNNIAVGDSIEITFVGYQTKRIKISSYNELFVQLEKDNRTLEEVMVANTGYQKIKPNEITGSVAIVDNALFNQQVGYNVLDRIKTITNGIAAFPQRIGTGPASDIIIRGLSTLTRSIQKPLVILDDFEYQGELDNINPNDVENITVLKDAAASSIWGARAANGVIVITTKRASFNKRTHINFTSNVTLGLEPDLKNIKEISSSDLVDLEVFLFNNKYRFADTASPRRYSFTPVYELLFGWQEGTISESEVDRLLNSYRHHDTRDDFKRLFYRNAANQQYVLSIDGGGQNIAWSISMGLDKNISNLSQRTNRYTFSLNNSYKPAKNLSINIAVNYAGTKNGNAAPAYGSIRGSNGGLPIYTMLVDQEGNALPVYHSYRKGYIDTLGGGRLMDWRYYPATDYQNITTSANNQHLNAGLAIDYKLTKWLSLKGNYRHQLQDSETETLYGTNSYYTRDLINNFTQLGATIKYGIPKGDIQDYRNSAITAQNLRGQLIVEQKWTFSYLSFIAGGEISQTSTKSRSDRTYGFSPDILTYVNVDHVNNQPLLMGGSAGIPDMKSINSSNIRYASFFTNGSYVYKDRYSVSASARRDASNNFGVATNDRWKPLWSAGLAWQLSKERFYIFKGMPYLKLRATYGYQGNVDVNKVAVITTRYRGTVSLTGMPYADIENFPNPDLRWEQTAIINFGLDYRVINDRISGSIEYYRKNITDLYGDAPVDPTTGTGVSTLVKNMGNARGQGWDIVINTKNLAGALGWNTRFFLNTNTMKVLKYREVPALGSALAAGTFTPIDGYSPYSFFAYRWAGLDPLTGDPQGYINGEVSKDYNQILTRTEFSSLRYIGSLIPTVTGNFSNDFKWKKLSITISMNYRMGYYVRKTSIDYYALMFQQTGHSDYEKRWIHPGNEKHTQVPSFIFPVNSQRDNFYKSSEVLAARGDHVRLSYINIAYDLKNTGIKGFQGLRMYIVANNLGIVWKKDKTVNDPDISDRSVPPARTFAAGLNISF